ncbi:MAG: hypothetical protein RIM84_09975 [Alphaproteobacteria bacterium]
MPRLCFYAGLFCVTAATLMLQLIQTRLLSVVAWYHLAFFVISIAMFGLTAGAVWVYLRGKRYSEATLSHDLAFNATAFALATAGAFAVQMTLALVVVPGLTTLLIWLQLAVLLAVPFFFSGVVVSLALTRSPFPVGRVYGVDLIGAAVGCFGVLGLLSLSDGPSAVLWTAALAALGAWLFARSGIGTAPPRPSPAAGVLNWRGVWLVLLVALAALNSLDRHRLGLYPVYAKGSLQIGQVPWFEHWNSYSRVVADRPVSAHPYLWGPSPLLVPEDWRLAQSMLTIDGDAGTAGYGIAGNLERAGFLRYDVTNLAYHLPRRRRSAVIGVGGGRDAIGARLFGVERVTGVEINPAFVHLLRDDPNFAAFVGLDRIGGIDLVVDEARSWFARSEARFDLIQMSLVDTWAATGAGAFTLSENGLYTVEAWRIFLDHLAPGGVYTVSRWYWPEDVAEAGRMVSLAVAALLERGAAHPKDHIYLAASGRIATLVLSRDGFAADELAALKQTVARMRFKPLIEPDAQPASDVLARIVNARDLTALQDFTGSFRLDLTPSRDERPFFFNQLPLHDAAEVAAMVFSGRAAGVGRGNLVATNTLVTLFLISLMLVFAAIYIPLRHTLADVGARLAAGGSAYFMLIGIGFMVVEIGLLQRFSVFLGHPIYALAIVLFSLILSAGLGSMLSDRCPMDRRGALAIWAVATAAYVFAQTVWLPPLLLDFDSAGLAGRGLLTVAAILPAGLLMGFGFPTGMRLVAAHDTRPTPWFWGINGASGVFASAVAVACSIAYGIGTTLTVGAVCYLLLIPAAFVIGFPRTPAAA